jgi:K+-transporting ATPase ATPase C chain
MTSKNRRISNLRPIVRLAVLSLLICGLLFPLLIAGLAQVFFPYQTGGEIIQLNGTSIGSNLIAQNFNLTARARLIFFQERNDSASLVDPDITLQDAYSQVPRISNATGISPDSLKTIINENEEGTFWIFGSPYVNVLRINLALIKAYHFIYYPYIYEGYQSIGLQMLSPNSRLNFNSGDDVSKIGFLARSHNSSKRFC